MIGRKAHRRETLTIGDYKFASDVRFRYLRAARGMGFRHVQRSSSMIRVLAPALRLRGVRRHGDNQ
jgi:hypothetical protein